MTEQSDLQGASVRKSRREIVDLSHIIGYTKSGRFAVGLKSIERSKPQGIVVATTCTGYFPFVFTYPGAR